MVNNNYTTWYVTGPKKTGLIYTKGTYSYYGIYLLFCTHYTNSVSFIDFPMEHCIGLFDEIFITMLKMLQHFKDSKWGQFLHADKTGFLRPGHICMS